MKRVMLAAVVAVFLPITSSANDLTGRFGMSSASLSSLWSGGSFDADYNTTNYGLTYSFDNGYSIDHRQHFVRFCFYFNTNHTPIEKKNP